VISAIATRRGFVPVIKSILLANDIVPGVLVFLKIDILPEPLFGTTISILPSPSKSPNDTLYGSVPAVKSTLGANELDEMDPPYGKVTTKGFKEFADKPEPKSITEI
jgi:hypothetical protein